MKITYIANIRIPTEKAHGLAIMKMCEAFADNGITVELVVPRRKNHIKENYFQYYGIKENFKITELWCLDLVRFGKIGFWIEVLTFSERLAWYVIFKKGIFYTRDEFIAFFLKILGKKVFWEAHTAKRYLWKYLLKIVDGVITISGGLKTYYVSKGFGLDKVIVAHSGVDSSKFDFNKDKAELRKELSLPQDKKIVAYIGKRNTMGEGKGVEELENILKSLAEKDADIYPLIVSNAPLRLLPSYMKSSDILVMNYPNLVHYAKYMSPLKLFEYMSSGTPIVSSDLPSIREILGEEDAYFFEPDNAQSLAKVIDKVFEKYDEAKVKADKALEKVRQYSWKKRAESIVSFIKA